MQQLIEHLQADPSDHQRWQVCIDKLLDEPFDIAPDAQDALEKLLSEAAHRCLPDAVITLRPLPLLHVDIRDGQPWLLRAQTHGAWYTSSISIDALANEVSCVPSGGAYALLSDLTRRAFDALSLRRPFEPRLMSVAHVHTLVASVDDPHTERWVGEVQALYPDVGFDVGDGVEEPAPLETQILLILLVLALRQARPLRIIAPPDPDTEIEDALAREVDKTGLSLEEILEGLDARMTVRFEHDYAIDSSLLLDEDDRVRLVRRVETVATSPRRDQCLASEVGVTPGTQVAFDRGSHPIDRVCSVLVRAFVDWNSHLHERIGWDPDSEEDPTTLTSLLPLNGSTAVALIRKIRAHRPICWVTRATGDARRFDDFSLVARLEALTIERQIEVLITVGETAAEGAKLERVAPFLAELRRVVADKSDPHTLFVPAPSDVHHSDLIMDLIEGNHGDIALLLLFIGDLACRRLGRSRLSGMWAQDPISIQAATSLLALRCGELRGDEEIDRLLDPLATAPDPTGPRAAH